MLPNAEQEKRGRGPAVLCGRKPSSNYQPCRVRYGAGGACEAEEEDKAAFVSAYNQLVYEKAENVANAEIIRQTLCRMDALEEEKQSLADEMNVLVEVTQGIVAENARIAQDQDEYQKRYNALVERYDAAKAKYGAVVDRITAKEAQSARLLDFIKMLEAQDGILAEFDERLWSSMVDFITVGRRKEKAVTFKDGTEIMA